jgi:bile-salt sulfotransferase
MGKMIEVYSHPRSGTNLLMAFIAENFYPDRDLMRRGGVMGHWRSPIPSLDPWPYGALFGNHHFYEEGMLDGPACYIFRDGRDVAVSLWRTKAFLNPDWQGLSFSEFLRRELDWKGSPGAGGSYDGTPAEHWRDHLRSWEKAPALLVRFEDLLSEPGKMRAAIAQQFDLTPAFETVEIREKVGPFPHEGRIGIWREFFTDEDLEYFHRFVSPSFWGLWDES